MEVEESLEEVEESLEEVEESLEESLEEVEEVEESLEEVEESQPRAPASYGPRAIISSSPHHHPDPARHSAWLSAPVPDSPEQ